MVAGGRRRLLDRAAPVLLCAVVVVAPLARDDRGLLDSDWTSFAVGAVIASGPHPEALYDRAAQQAAQDSITRGRGYALKGQGRLLPFLSPPWVALLAVPFERAGLGAGGRLFVLVQVAALALGVTLAVPGRRRAAAAVVASFPTLDMALNVQLDGLVVLGIGAAMAAERAGREWLAGLALGLTLVKPHLVIPLAAAVLLRRRWRVVAGWGLAGLGLVAIASLREPGWMPGWFGAASATVGRNGREIDPGTWGWLYDLPARWALGLTVAISLVALALVLAAAARAGSRERALAVLVAGGPLVAPHALASDLTLTATAIAVGGGARLVAWAVFSEVTFLAAATADPWPSLIATGLGGLLLAWMAGRTGRPATRSPAGVLAR